MSIRWLELACIVAASSCSVPKLLELEATSSDRALRDRPAGAPESSPNAPPVLLLALDGVSRDLLYDMLRAGELPNFSTLLGGDQLAHAYLDTGLVSTLPSTTMAAWVTALTGVGPADHGVTGNEYFIRERRDFACPAPISFVDAKPTLAIYTDRYLDKLVDAPTVYERMRERDPNVLIWVAMNHLFRGADRILMAKRTAIVKAFAAVIEKEVTERTTGVASPKSYAALDTAAVDLVVTHLARGPAPDVLTLYISGTDLYAHVASEGPDQARRAYMREVVDPQLGRIVTALRERGMLDRLWVVSIADHGHTAVVHDERHALGTGGMDAPPIAVLRGTGFRVRPLRHEVDLRDPFSAVVAYGGAMAYVYLADRSRCAGATDPCPWQLPPRYTEDVLPVAEAYFRANRDGTLAPGMKGTLDMILVRRPRPVDAIDLPFEVYTGDGKTESIEHYLAGHPHPTYVDFEQRMRHLAVGVHGERAGDILLLAHDGDVDQPEQRFYFAAPYHSWHGSPSHADSDIPLIVANRRHASAAIARTLHHTIGEHPGLERITDLLLAVRAGQFE